MCFNCHVTIQKKKSPKKASFFLTQNIVSYLPSILLLLYCSKAALKEECLEASLASKQARYFSLFGRKQALTICLI